MESTKICSPKACMFADAARPHFTNRKANSTPTAAGQVLRKKSPEPSSAKLTMRVWEPKLPAPLAEHIWGTFLKVKNSPPKIPATVSILYLLNSFPKKNPPESAQFGRITSSSRRHRLMVRTPGLQSGNTGSIPVGGTRF